MCFFLDLLVLTCNISIETCAYVLLSWYALRGEALRPPPCTPPPAFFFKTGFPCYCYYYYYFYYYYYYHYYYYFYYYYYYHYHYHLLLSWYALRGEALRPPRCALPPAPPHPLLFLNRFPLLPTIPFFLHKHHRLFGLISSLLISIETCAYVLLS